MEATKASQRRWLTGALAVVAVLVLDAVVVLTVLIPVMLAVLVVLQVEGMPTANETQRLVIEDGFVLAIGDVARGLGITWVDATWHALGSVTAIPFAVWLSRKTFAMAADRWRERENAVADQIRPSVRVAINEFVNQRHPTRLLVENAQGLTEIHASHQLVHRDQFERVRTLTERLGAKTIAISGVRGIGKTTMLRQIGAVTADDSSPRSLRVVVSAPHTYEPYDFLVHLYLRLCDEVLQRVRVRPASRRWIRTIAVLARAAGRVPVLTVAVGLLLFFTLEHEHLTTIRDNLPEGVARDTFDLFGSITPGSTLSASLAIAGLAVLFWLAGRIVPSANKPVSSADVAIASQADGERRRLSFLRTATAERQQMVGRWGLLISKRSSSQLAERPIGLPELVNAYRAFAAGVASWLRQQMGREAQVIVAVDELDRITEAEAAEAFLNGIKPILGSPDIVYIVSVSEEALARIERLRERGYTVIDSVFDAVVPMKTLSLRESISMIRRRVIGFPDSFIALAHCLSGGIPRDLIRIVRTMVEVRVASRKSELADLLALVVLTQFAELRRSMMGRLTGHQSCGLGRLVNDQEWPLLDVVDSIWWESTSPLVLELAERSKSPGHNEECRRMFLQLAGRAYFLATVHDVFSGGMESRGWQASRGAAGGPGRGNRPHSIGFEEFERVVDGLADVYQLTSVDSEGACSRLDVLRASLGLSQSESREWLNGSETRLCPN